MRLKPLRTAGRLDTHYYQTRQSFIKPLGLSVSMRQLAFHQLARFQIQHRDLLKARMKITTDILHIRPPSVCSELLVHQSNRVYSGQLRRPSSCNQAQHSERGTCFCFPIIPSSNGPAFLSRHPFLKWTCFPFPSSLPPMDLLSFPVIPSSNGPAFLSLHPFLPWTCFPFLSSLPPMDLLSFPVI